MKYGYQFFVGEHNGTTIWFPNKKDRDIALRSQARVLSAEADIRKCDEKNGDYLFVIHGLKFGLCEYNK